MHKLKIDELTIVLIVAIIALIVGINDKMDEIKRIEAEKLTETLLSNNEISFVNNGIIDEYKLKEIEKMSYNDLKNALNIKNDFCIYIEDENGNVILSKGSPSLSQDRACVG